MYSDVEKLENNILNQWRHLKKFFFQLIRMTRDVLAILAVEVECERVFNIAKACYDHRKQYNSNTFFALMLMRFFEQKKNTQEKLNVDFEINEQLTHEELIREMKRRELDMRNAYNTQYISDNEEIDDIKLNDSLSSLHNTRTISRFTLVIIRKLINIRRKRNEHLITENLCQIRRKRRKKNQRRRRTIRKCLCNLFDSLSDNLSWKNNTYNLTRDYNYFIN